MRKSVKVRVIIFDIINEIYQKNKNFDDSFIDLTKNYKLNDPIEIASKEIIKKKIASKKVLENINKKIIHEIKDAAEYALNSPFPAEEDLYTNVYL